MKAVCYDKGKNTLVVREIERAAPRPCEAVIQTAAVGVCGSDLTLFSSGVLTDGYVMGHEIAGIIRETGRSVDRFRVGDRVVVRAAGCGACVMCATGLPHLCTAKLAIGTGSRPGGYAEYVNVPEAMLMRVPDEIDLVAGALVDTVAVACHGISRAEFKPGEGAVVFGAGPIGLSAVMILRKMGAAKIGVVEMNEGRKRAALEFGADIVVSPTEEGFLERLKEAFSGMGPDAAIECAGRVPAVESALCVVRPGGRVSLVGIIFEPMTISLIAITMREVTILPVFSTRTQDSEAAMEFIQEDPKRACELISDEIGIKELPRAFSELLSGAPKKKVMVTFNQG